MRSNHLRDDELLLLAACELPWWRRVRAKTHFDQCGSCRARGSKLESSLREATTLQQSMQPRNVAVLRAALLQKLSEPSAGMDLPVLAPHSGRWQIVAACTALVMLTATIWSTHFVAPEVLDGLVARSHDAALPIKRLTPGATRASRVEELCSTEGPEDDRAIDASTERKVFQEYRLPISARDAYEVDFLITPGLGGAEDIRNLWPEPYQSTMWNARVKNQLETHLHRMVCAGQMPLSKAQAEIAANWISAYKQAFHTDVPVETEASLAESVPGR
jgi:hypothetical protein